MGRGKVRHENNRYGQTGCSRVVPAAGRARGGRDSGHPRADDLAARGDGGDGRGKLPSPSSAQTLRWRHSDLEQYLDSLAAEASCGAAAPGTARRERECDMNSTKPKDANQKSQTPAQSRTFGPRKQRSAIGLHGEPAVARRLEAVPAIYRAGYLKAVGGRSPKAAIKANCLECVGWQRAEVTRCSSPACPLYGYRPFQQDRSGKGRWPTCRLCRSMKYNPVRSSPRQAESTSRTPSTASSLRISANLRESRKAENRKASRCSTMAYGNVANLAILVCCLARAQARVRTRPGGKNSARENRQNREIRTRPCRGCRGQAEVESRPLRIALRPFMAPDGGKHLRSHQA